MTKGELALKLNGRPYKDELPDDLDAIAKENGLFVVFAYSDDNMEVGGFGNNEISAYGGVEVVFCSDGDCEDIDVIGEIEDDEDRQIKLLKSKKKKNLVTAVCGGSDKYMWHYETKLPHSTFDIIKEGEPFCQGIVFSVHDLK